MLFRIKRTSDRKRPEQLPCPEAFSRVAETSTEWYVDVDDLVAFSKAHGQVILSVAEDGPELEIYDDYRE